MEEKRTRLIDELAKHKGETVFIGVKSSFFFVGPCEEALSNIQFVDLVEKSYAALMGRRIGFANAGPTGRKSESSIAERPVVKVYRRDSGRAGEVVILLEGKGFGMFWTRKEYIAGRDVLKKALDMAMS